MDIIAYGAASKAAKEEKITREDVLGEGVEGSYSSVRKRIDSLEEGIESVNEQANKLIVNDSINIMKAHAKLNAIAKTTKYEMHNMVFDDLLDLSGIDTTKSKGYTHDAVEGTLIAEDGCVIETKEEVTDAVPSKVILTVEEITSTVLDHTPKMTSNSSPSPYVLSGGGSKYNDDYWHMFDGNHNSGWQGSSSTSNMWFSFDFGPDNEKIINRYTITNGSINTAPTKWNIYGSNDNENWVEIDSVSTNWNKDKIKKEFQFKNQIAFRYYKFKASSIGYSGLQINIREIEFLENRNIKNKLLGKYYISRDNGITWEQITPDTLFYFKDSASPLDNKIRLKVELPSGTKLLNYALTWA